MEYLWNMKEFKLVLTMNADSDYLSLNKLEIEAEEADVDIAMEAISILRLDEALQEDSIDSLDEPQIDDNTAVALGLGMMSR